MPEETKVTNELLYEVLKSIQTQVSETRTDMDMIKSRTSAIEKSMGDLQASMGAVNQRMDRVELAIRSLARHAQTEDAFVD